MAASAQAELSAHMLWRVLLEPAFGGVSGLEISDDGSQLTAITDRGHLLRARMERDPTGTLTGITRPDVSRLIQPGGAWPGRWSERDAEGLALLPDGRFAVSYEGYHRVAIHAADATTLETLPRPVQIFALQTNLGLEGLAVDRDGSLLAIAEMWGWRLPAHPLLRYRDGRWTETVGLPQRIPWFPVGLDVDDLGRVYLLERRVSLRRGFASRVWRYTLNGADIAREDLLVETQFADYGNLEGIALWHAPDGARMLTLVSDDNFNPVMTTEIVEYRLPD